MYVMFSHRSSVRLSVCHMGGLVKNGASRDCNPGIPNPRIPAIIANPESRDFGSTKIS